MNYRPYLPSFVLVLCSVFFLHAEDIVTFRPAPQRPDYDDSKVLESYAAALKYSDACIEYGKEKEAFLESLTSEQFSLYYETHRDDLGSHTLEPSMPGEGYSWFDSAAQWQFSEEDAVKISETKLLIGHREWKESFQVYTEGGGPFFITSDAVLNGFHRLVEMSAIKVELARYDQLETYLETVWQGLEKSQVENPHKLQIIDEGRLHARIFIGVALTLLGVEPDGCDPRERRNIDATMKLINGGQTGPIPDWLGEPSEDFTAIDYSKFKPTGFYDRNPRLAAVYKTVKWLQSIPFRLDRDVDLAAASIINKTITVDYDFSLNRLVDNALLPIGLEGICSSSYRFGPLAFGDPNWMKHLIPSRFSTIEALEEEFEETRSQIYPDRDSSPFFPEYDQIRKTNDTRLLQIRMFPSYELPETTLWNYLRGEQRIFSEGYEVTAMLGSTEGSALLENYLPGAVSGITDYSLESYLRDSGYYSSYASEEHRKSIMAEKPNGYYWGRSPGHTLYLKYLLTLGTLFGYNDLAPDFVKSSAWDLKSCNTALASWAQMRHTLAAVTQENAFYLGLVMVPPGFVEPNPEFFRRLADTEKAFFEYFLDRGLTYDDSDLKEQMKVKELIQLIEDSGLNKESLSANELRHLSEENQLLFDKLIECLYKTDEEELRRLFSTDEDADPDQSFTEPILFQRFIETVRNQLENEDENSGFCTEDHQIILRWMSLIDLTRHLEGMANKQLAGIDWTEDEAAVIRNFGEQLAFIMGYDGNSWLTPNDDSPRIVTIESDPLTGIYQHVGISKPRSFYVLYPWEGREILCHGAVFPYQTKRDNQRLTDNEWKQILEQEKPEPATWLEPILSTP